MTCHDDQHIPFTQFLYANVARPFPSSPAFPSLRERKRVGYTRLVLHVILEGFCILSVLYTISIASLGPVVLKYK